MRAIGLTINKTAYRCGTAPDFDRLPPTRVLAMHTHYRTAHNHSHKQVSV